MFYVSCGVILLAFILNTVLIYFQLWRPFKAEEGREEDIEVGEGDLDEEGSSSACFCFLTIFILGIGCFIVLNISVSH